MILQKKISGLFCIGALNLFLVCCTALPMRDTAAAVYDWRALAALKSSPLFLGEVALQYADELEEFTYPFGEIIKPLALEYGYSVFAGEDGEERTDKRYVLDIWIKEESFFKGIDFLVSIAGTFRIREKESNGAVFSMTIVEESKETLRSFRSLYRMVTIFFKRMDHESGKKQWKD